MRASECEYFEIQDSCSINFHDPFYYVPLTVGPYNQGQQSTGKKIMNIKSSFTPFITTSTNVTSSQPNLTQPTLDNYWKKQCK